MPGMKSPMLKQFGTRIKQLRHEQHISQEELAEKCDLHRTYVGGIERGERNPSLKNIYKIASAFQIELEELFEDVK